MKTITIQTTHNVAIDYELANVWERILAFFIDSIILVGYIFLMMLILIPFSFNDEARWLVLGIFYFPVFFFYHFTCEVFWGAQSIGKKALRLKVIKNTGGKLNIGDFTMRWIFRLIDILFSAGSVAVISILANDRNQRLGDVLGNTSVIKLEPQNKLNAKDILKIKDLSKYEPKYPKVVNFAEDDMLLLKNTLDRAKKNPNNNYKELLEQLTVKICEELDIKEKPKKRTVFLKTILNDYIVLTR